MTTINIHISIIILNINGLHSQIKRYRQTEWIEKQNPFICSLQETYPNFQFKKKFRLKKKRVQGQMDSQKNSTGHSKKIYSQTLNYL